MKVTINRIAPEGSRESSRQITLATNNDMWRSKIEVTGIVMKWFFGDKINYEVDDSWMCGNYSIR